MDWAALQNGLKAWFAQASGLALPTLAWDGEAEVFRAYPRADLQLHKHAAEDGTDEVRYELASDGRLLPTVIGNRLVTLLITVESRDQRPATKAFSVLDPVRTKLALPASIDAFDALDVTVRDTEPTVDLGRVGDKREFSAASLSIQLAYTVLEVAAEDEAVDPVESVELGGTVAGIGLVPTVFPDQVFPS